MATISITFQEEGDQPVSFTLSSEIAAALDRYVAVSKTVNPSDGTVSPTYQGKADLFLQHTVNTLLRPIISQYPSDAIKAKQDQIAALQNDIQGLIVGALTPVV